MFLRTLLAPVAFCFAAYFTFGAAPSAHAQTSPSLQVGLNYTFTLLDSTRISGVLDSVTDRFIYFTPAKRGSDRVYRAAVARIGLGAAVGQGSQAQILRQSPHGSRSFFAPTAIPMKRGELLYSNVLVEYNTFEFALTDHVSVGASGLLFSSLFWGLQMAPTLKYAHSFSPTRHAAVGAVGLLGTWQGAYESGSAMPFAAYTWGTADRNVTAGMGWVYDDLIFGTPVKKWARYPTIYLSGTRRVAKRWLVGGEYALTTFTGITTWTGGTEFTLDGTSNAGIAYARYLWPRFSVDAGLGVHVDHWGWAAALPLVGASFRL